MMNILLLTPYLPFPSESGGAIRSYGLLRSLSDAGYSLTLLSLTRFDPDPLTNPLFQHCRQVHTAASPKHSKLKRFVKLISTNKADIEFRLASACFESKLKQLLRDNVFDAIQFSGIELGCYLPLILAGKKNARVVYDAYNAEAALQNAIFDIERQRLGRLPIAVYSAVQARRLKRFEQWICQTVDHVISASEADQRLLNLYGGAPTSVVPNGIFVDDYRPPANHKRASNQLVFTGKMDYRPNVDAMEWFSARILPRVRRRCPRAELVIVGRSPHRRVQALAAKDHITVTGWVDSVQPYLHAAALAVVPLRMGSGTRLKILEAMASGCAVVSTSLGAAGLRHSIQQAIEIADSEADFAQIIVSLLQDEKRRQTAGIKASQQVSRCCDWQALAPNLLQAYQDVGIG